MGQESAVRGREREREEKLGGRDGSVMREPERQPGSTILWEGWSGAGVMGWRGGAAHSV